MGGDALAGPELPLPVLRPVRWSRPAIRSSLSMSTNWRTATRMSADVLLRCPRQRFGKLIPLCAPPHNARGERSRTLHHRYRQRLRGSACDTDNVVDVLLQPLIGSRRIPVFHCERREPGGSRRPDPLAGVFEARSCRWRAADCDLRRDLPTALNSEPSARWSTGLAHCG